MFCYQCQQTAGGTGCTEYGVCGKDPKTAALQDLLSGWIKQIAQKRVAYRGKPFPSKKKRPGKAEIRSSRVVDRFLLEALYATLTNVNFDPAEIARLIMKAGAVSLFADDLGMDIDLEELDSCKIQIRETEAQLEQPGPMPTQEEIDELLAQAMEAFYWIRGLSAIEKKPSTSELVDWIRALQLGGIPTEKIRKEIPFAGVLLKKDKDIDRMERNKA